VAEAEVLPSAEAAALVDTFMKVQYLSKAGQIIQLQEAQAGPADFIIFQTKDNPALNQVL
jgi:hypothetical protein